MNQKSAFATPMLPTKQLSNLGALLSVAFALIEASTLNDAEIEALTGVTRSDDLALIAAVRAAICAGLDPLGDAYCTINNSSQRRGRGQTFTPQAVVGGMITWAKRQCVAIHRLVDPGAGTGRYTLAALRAFPHAKAVAVESDPVVALILRANLAAAGLTDRAEVVLGDFRSLKLPRIEGKTLWIGNPPYIRHHDIHPEWKTWYAKTLRRFGHDGSQLAGLHLHFFLKTLEIASDGDLGCYVTAAEWLDVKYGQALRQLLANELGGQDIFVVDPTVPVFPDALVSAAITCFSPGSSRANLRFAEITNAAQLRELVSGNAVEITKAKAESKWSFLVKGGRARRPAGFIELGELFRVSRGQVTGLNRVWVSGGETPVLPSRFLIPAITDSADITQAHKHVIDNPTSLRRVISLPANLDELEGSDKEAVDRFLNWAQSLGAHETYVARHRKHWWSVVFKEAAPIVMTYMGRRPPAFAINKASARLINVAHGLYPYKHVSEEQAHRLVAWLNVNVSKADGRVYAGGLTKFEPSEAMRILIPESLAA